MLTQAMPALTNAFRGILRPNAIKALTQALGNCNMDLTHRGNVVVQPDAWQNVNNSNGVYNSYPPSNQQYNEYVNQYINPSNFYDIVNSIYNNPAYYNTNIDYGDVITVLGGPPGDPGRDGRSGLDGVAGVDGLAGRDGRDGLDGFSGPPGTPGAAGQNGIDGRDGYAGRDGIGVQGPSGPPGTDGAAGPAGRDGRDGRDGVVDYDIVFRNVTQRLKKYEAEVVIKVEQFRDTEHEVVVEASFDPDSCEVTTETETIDAHLLSVMPRTKTIKFYGPP
jgi:hypothetical protein